VSVTVAVGVTRRPYGAFNDRHLPTGLWTSRGEATGDGSGGVITVQMVFADAVQARTSEIFSLEQYSIGTASGVATTAQILTQNFDPDLAGPRPVANASQRWQVPMALTGFGGADILARDARALGGMFLGRQDRGGVATLLISQIDEETGVTMLVRAQGYVWGPRSVSTPEGPQRPLQGLYKA